MPFLKLDRQRFLNLSPVLTNITFQVHTDPFPPVFIHPIIVGFTTTLENPDGSELNTSLCGTLKFSGFSPVFTPYGFPVMSTSKLDVSQSTTSLTILFDIEFLAVGVSSVIFPSSTEFFNVGFVVNVPILTVFGLQISGIPFTMESQLEPIFAMSLKFSVVFPMSTKSESISVSVHTLTKVLSVHFPS